MSDNLTFVSDSMLPIRGKMSELSTKVEKHLRSNKKEYETCPLH